LSCEVMAVAVNIEKETLMVDWPIWTMMAAWVGEMVERLKEVGCMTEDAADLMRRDLAHSVVLATEAVKNKDVNKMYMARDIVISVIDNVIKTFDSCGERGEKA